MAETKIGSNGLRILMVNIRSLRTNFDEFNLYRKSNAKNFELLGLVESWIKEDEAYRFKIDNYDLYVQERENQRSGGVALYVRSDLNCSVSKINSQQFNALRFTINSGLNPPISGLLVYRFGQQSVKLFTEQIESIMVNASERAIVFGDMNLNLFDAGKCSGYLNTMQSLGFKSLINTATRITNCSETCIDHFWFRGGPGNNTNSNARHDLVELPFTDHSLARVSLSWNHVSKSQPADKISKFTNWKSVNEKLSTQKWNSVLRISDVDEAFDNFINTIREIIDSCTTEKRVQICNYKSRSPWISHSLVKLSAWKNELFRLTKKYPNNASLKYQLDEVTKNLRIQMRTEKRKYFSRKIEACGGNSAKYWQLIKGVTQGPNHEIKAIKMDGKTIPAKGNEGLVANAFNEYFSTVVQRLLAGVNQSVPRFPGSGSTKRSVNSFVCGDVTPSEIAEIVVKMPNKTSKGLDDINIIFIKNYLDDLLIPLSHLYSLSLNQGIFPKSFKTAVIIPLLKKGDPEMISNYRPISILSTLSKILEKIVHKRLLGFLIKYSYFSPKQYGFLPGKSTEKAILDKVYEITQKLESKQQVACIYFDITKAFDAVQHDILLEKLERLGVRGPCHSWFRSYLVNREQRVKIGGIVGNSRTVNSGVPQGSSLGPLLFLVYVNDLLQQELEGLTYSFADDTALVYHGKTSDTIVEKINRDLEKLLDWFHCHKLIPNADKTKLIRFSYKNKLLPLDPIKLHQRSDCPQNCLCPIIEQTDSTKYLGLNVDSELKWHRHTQFMQIKLRKLNYLIYHAKKFFSTRHLLRIYFCVYEPVIRYGLVHWGGASKSYINTLEILQRKAVRAIAGIRQGDGSQKWFKKFRILTIPQLYDLERVVYAHRNQGSFSSSSSSKPIDPVRRLTHEKRHGKILFKPDWTRDRSRIQSPYSIPKIYNGIPVKLKQIMNYKAFRKKLKVFIVGK